MRSQKNQYGRCLNPIKEIAQSLFQIINIFIDKKLCGIDLVFCNKTVQWSFGFVTLSLGMTK
jgi:hypothetical protein